MAAGNAVIGALRVVLGADTAALDKGLKDSQSKLSSFGSSVAKAGAVVGAAMVAVGASVAVAVKGAIDEADKMGKAAQKWGIPVDELSRLKHAADLSGVSFEGLGTATSRLSRNMSEVAGGAVNTASKAFQALGISVKNSDGTLKSSTKVMEEVAGKFGGMQDGAGKTAIAMALFGKSGAEMIPMLNAGATGLRDMMNEADQLGIVIDTKTAKAAEAFNDNLTRLGKVKDGIIVQITARMLPALQTMSDMMVEGAKNSNLMKAAGDGLATTLQVLMSAGVLVGTVFKVTGEILGSVAAAIVLAAQGKFQEAWTALKTGTTDVMAAVQDAATRVGAIWTAAAAENEASAPVLAKKLVAPIIQAADKAAASVKAIDGFLAAQSKSIAARAAELATIGLQAGARERLTLVMQAEAIAQEKGIQLNEAQRIKLTEAANAAENMALKIKGAQLVQANATPHEKFRQEIANNEAAMIAFGATSEQISAMQQRIAEAAGFTWHQQATSIAGSIGQIGQAFAGESKKMSLVAKAAGIAQSLISMWTGAARALTLPWPANMVAWAQVLATGATAVANIRSVAVGGFATGGSFTVPGGVGGGDRMRAMVDLEPGEQVDIWRPGQAGGDPRRGAAGGNTVNITLSGEYWGERSIRNLIERINDSLNDGSRLRIA